MTPCHRFTSGAHTDAAHRCAEPVPLTSIPDDATELTVGFCSVGINVHIAGSANLFQKQTDLKHDIARAFTEHVIRVLCLSEVGTIGVTTSSTSFNTSSDHRLKENVTDLTGATTRLKQLNPVRFNFIADADTTVDGFLAHEVQTVVPEAITGTHNEVDEDGNPVYQGIDQSKLVPLLVATIQELEARITALEAE